MEDISYVFNMTLVCVTGNINLPGIDPSSLIGLWQLCIVVFMFVFTYDMLRSSDNPLFRQKGLLIGFGLLLAVSLLNPTSQLLLALIGGIFITLLSFLSGMFIASRITKMGRFAPAALLLLVIVTLMITFNFVITETKYITIVAIVAKFISATYTAWGVYAAFQATFSFRIDRAAIWFAGYVAISELLVPRNLIAYLVGRENSVSNVVGDFIIDNGFLIAYAVTSIVVIFISEYSRRDLIDRFD